MAYRHHKSAKLEESLNRAQKAAPSPYEGLTEEELFTPAEYDQAAGERVAYSGYSYWRSTFRVFLKNKAALCLLILIAILLAFTFIQPLLPGQEGFLFGSNSIGQDLWSRVWSGTRTSLLIGFAVALVEAVVGVLVGVLWGYVRRLDRLFTEIYNVLDNIPQTIVLILIAYILRPSIQTLILSMCLTGWLGMSRFIRNQIVIIRDRDYNLASRCLGTPTFRIIFRNLLPYLVSVITLRMALAIPSAIGNEVFLTYIGLGLPVDTPSLGNLINEGRMIMTIPDLQYQLFFPAIVLSFITISFYIIGNAFADAADPKNHR